MILDEIIILPSGYAARARERELKAKGIKNVACVGPDVNFLRGRRAKRVTWFRSPAMSLRETHELYEYIRHVLTPDGILID